MKSLSLIALVALFATACRQDGVGPGEMAPEPDTRRTWSVAEATDSETGKLLVVSSRNQPLDTKQFSTLVTITWQYTDAQANTQPGAAVSEKIKGFQDAIAPLADSRGLSFLALIVTGLGETNWYFYTNDYDGFMKGFNALMHARKRAPVRIRYEEDSDWQIWRGYRERVNTKTANKSPESNSGFVEAPSE